MDQDERADVVETKRSSREVRNVDTNPPMTETRELDAAQRRDHMPPRSDMDRTESEAYDPYGARRTIGYRVTQLVYWVFALIEGLIAIRFVLKALDANPSAGFAQFIYGISNGLVSPFANLFANPTYQGATFELSSLMAFIVYALLAWLIGRLVWIVIGETRSALTTRTTRMNSRL
jgi:YGGT family